jgi:hypothetical protein
MLTTWLDIYQTVAMAFAPPSSSSGISLAADADTAGSGSGDSNSGGTSGNYEGSDEYKAESNVAGILVPLVIFHVLALAVVAARSYARSVMKNSFGKDDVAMVATGVSLSHSLILTAGGGSCGTLRGGGGMGFPSSSRLTHTPSPQIFAFGGMVTFFGMTTVGLGRHYSTIGHDDLVQLNAWDFAQTMLAHMTALGLLKISIALSLLRLSTSKWFQRVLWALIAFVVAYTLLGWFSFLLRCFPLRAYIDPDAPGNCYDVSIFVKLALANTGEWGGG